MTSKSSSWCLKHVMMTKGLSWLKKVRYDVKMLFMMSKIRHEIKNMSWRQKVRYDVKNTSCQKVRHDLKKSKSSSSCEKHTMTSKMLPWCQQVCHYVKKHIMMTKGSSLLKISSSWCQRRHDVKKFCHKIKNTSWRKNVCNNVKSLWSKNMSWRSKVRHDIKECVMSSKVPWRQNVGQKCSIRHDVKKFVASKFCHDVINTP